GGGGRGLGGLEETGRGQVGRVGEAGGVAHDHPDPGAPIPAGGEVLDLAVVEHGVGGGSVLHEDLGQVTPGAQGGGEGALDQILVEHTTPSSRQGAGVPTPLTRRRGWRIWYPGASVPRPA